MKVKFLPQIIENVIDIKSVEYNFVGDFKDNSFIFNQSNLQRFFDRGIFAFQIHHKVFNKTYKVIVTINYNDNTEIVMLTSPQDLLVS